MSIRYVLHPTAATYHRSGYLRFITPRLLAAVLVNKRRSAEMKVRRVEKKLD
jgi:hypothetical protein